MKNTGRYLNRILIILLGRTKKYNCPTKLQSVVESSHCSKVIHQKLVKLLKLDVVYRVKKVMLFKLNVWLQQ